MDTAWDHGITTFDTADAYGGGRSESFIGEWLATKSADGPRPDRDRDEDVQPDGRRRRITASAGRASAARSSRACGASGSSASRSTSRTPSTRRRRRRRRCRRFGDLVRAGKIGAVGASNFTGEQLAEALELSELEGLPRYEWVQNGFSLLEQGDRESVFPVCREHGLGYTPFSPLAGGWLTGKYRRGEPPPAGSRMTLRPEPYAGYDVRPRLRRARGARARRPTARGVSMAALALAWALAQPELTGVVVGPDHADHLAPAFEALDDRPLPGRPRPSDGGLLVSVLVLSEHDVRELLDMESCVAAMEDVLARLARGELTNPLRSLMLPPGPDGDGPDAGARRRATSRSSRSRRSSSRRGELGARARPAPGRGAPPRRRRPGSCSPSLNASPITEIRTAAVSARRDEAARAARLAHRGGARLRRPGTLARRRDADRARRPDHPHLEPQLRPTRRRSRSRRTRSSRPPSRRRSTVPTSSARRPSASEPIVELALAGAGDAHQRGRSASRTGGRESSARRPWQRHDSSSTGASRRSTRPATTCRAVEEQGIGPDHIVAELGELLNGTAEGRRSDEELTLFKSMRHRRRGPRSRAAVSSPGRASVGVGVEVDF